MITTRLIGGVGNQLFQSAMIFSFSKKHHVNYSIPETVINPHVPNKLAYKFPGFVYSNQPHNLEEYKEKSFRYEEIPPMDNVCFNGYWQSFKYSEGYRKELLEAIGFPYQKNEGVVAIHVRRGDYLTSPDHHPVITEAYLGKAIYFFMQRGYYNFKVFSDDIEWCKENIGDKTYRVEFSEGNDEVEDMIDASCCEHSIGSNSSYSWWLHYLNRNKNKIGVYPKKWFGSALGHDTTDLFISNSIML